MKVTASRNQKILNAILNALSCCLVGINVKESVVIAKRLAMVAANRNVREDLYAVIFAENHVQGIVLHALNNVKPNALTVSVVKIVEKFALYALNLVKSAASILSAQENVRNLAITNLATCPVLRCSLATTLALACAV